MESMRQQHNMLGGFCTSESAQFLLDPEEGTFGPELEVVGFDLGSKKGQVSVGEVALKVSEWLADSIVGSLGEALAEDVYDLTVIPKEPRGILPITGQEFFAVKPPEVVSLSSSSGKPLEEITISGRFFGSKKGKVLFEYESKGIMKL